MTKLTAEQQAEWMSNPENRPQATEKKIEKAQKTKHAIDQAVYSSRECLEFDIIGALLQKGSVVDSDGVTEDHFTGRYQTIFKALEALSERCGGFDVLAVYAEIGQERMIQMGGASFLNDMHRDGGIPSALPHSLKALKGFIKRETMSEIARDLALGIERDGEVLHDTIHKLQQIGSEIESVSHVGDIVNDALLSLSAPGVQGVQSGIEKLDRAVGGVSKLFSVVAAKPGIGKSSFLMSLAINFALAGKKVFIWSGEDSKEQMAKRFIVRLARDETSIERVAAASKLKTMPIWMDSTSGMSGADLSALCHERQKQHGIDVVIVDHLGKIRESGKDLYQKTSAVSGKLADMQLSLDVPVIAACQLRRGQPGDTKTPGLEDLRDSGWVEADARQVIILNRPYYHYQTGQIADPPDKHEFWVNIAKNNHGTTTMLKLWCDMSKHYIGNPPEFTTAREDHWQDGY